jgi:hypothetical protein
MVTSGQASILLNMPYLPSNKKGHFFRSSLVYFSGGPDGTDSKNPEAFFTPLGRPDKLCVQTLPWA